MSRTWTIEHGNVNLKRETTVSELWEQQFNNHLFMQDQAGAQLLASLDL